MNLEEYLARLQLIYSSTDFPIYHTYLTMEEKIGIWNWVSFLSFEMNDLEVAQDIAERVCLN